MIDTRIIETVVTEQKKELKRLSSRKFVPRHEEKEIDLDSELAQVVIGVRRSGKSTLCFNTLQKADVPYAYINFDDERLDNIVSSDLNNILEILYKVYGDFNYLFIDEIQNIKSWYLFVNRLLRQGLHVIVTGSNAKLLSGELATHLTGRYHQIELYTFDFEEYCNYNEVDTHTLTTKYEGIRRNEFDKYLRMGGFPALLREKNSRDYINSLVSSIITRDIEQRFRMKYPAAFEKLANHLLNNAPFIINEKELQKLFNIKSAHTVENYINYLKQAYLVIGLHKYSTKSKLRVHGEKVYPIDIALLNQRTDAFAGENIGWRLECLVYLALLRTHRPKQRDLFYYRDGNNEADFLVCDGNKVLQVVQVSYDVSAPKTLKREIAGLVAAAKKTRCNNLLLITDHYRSDVVHSGYNIRIRPAHEWLLNID